MREEKQYFESTFRHFGVFDVELHPLLDHAADAGLRVVDQLEAGDVGSAFPQVGQVDVQETLKQDEDPINRYALKNNTFKRG